MSFNYFGYYEEKYCCKISDKKPLIIRLDGKDIFKDRSIDAYDMELGGFADSLIKTGKQISYNYKALCMVCTDELNIISLNNFISKRYLKTTKVQKIASLISQDIHLEFNSKFKKRLVYFDARSFNIEEDKVKSYIKYRKATARNATILNLSKKVNGIKKYRKKIHEIEKYLPNKLTEYQEEGKIFYYGKELDVNQILNLEIINHENLMSCVKKTNNKNTQNTSDKLLKDFEYEDINILDIL